jgi:hypothetical protein
MATDDPSAIKTAVGFVWIKHENASPYMASKSHEI